MPTLPLWMWLFGVGTLVGLGYVVYYAFIQEEDEEDEGDAGYDGGRTMAEGGETLGETLLSTAAEERAARKSRMLALKDSLERSLEGRDGEGAETKDRMSMPWFLLLGPAGSGKTTMLANTGLPLPYGPAFEVDSRKRDAGRWWLFHDAVVLEAPAASAAIAASDSTLPPGQTLASDTSEGWNTLLHMLRRERPDAPLNGIVVTVSCSDLVGGRRDSEKLAETADRIRAFLERTRNVLEVRLPIHILVTKCDVLAGFRSFADNLPADRRNDIFGWANPNPVETPFNPSWVDIGCEALKKELEDLRDEVLAAPDEIKDADGLFVFVNEFGNLQEPLRDFVSRLYTDGERRPPLFFRGVYFCGDAMDPNQRPAGDEQSAANRGRATMQLSAEVALTGATSSHNLVFLKSLFTDKIFREAGLAKPVARFRLSRDRRVVVAQAAAALIALVGSTGLYTTVNGIERGDSAAPQGLRAQADALAHALAGMAIDLDEIRRGAGTPDSLQDRRSRDAAVIELVEELKSLRAIERSPFIPASWFDPLPKEVKSSLRAGVQDIVLPVIRERLDERLKELLDTTDFDMSTGQESVMSNPRLLADYLNEVRILSRHVNSYNRLAKAGSGTVADLSSLLDYLFSMQFGEAGAADVSDDFRATLVEAVAPPIVMPPQLGATVVRRSMRLVSSLGEQAGRQLAKPVDARAERAIDPQDDLQALRQLGTLVELSDPRRGIMASVSDSLILGANVARQVQDSVAAQVKNAAIRMSGDSLAADLQAGRLRTAMDTLFSLRLMDPIEESEIVADYAPNQRLRWDVGRLELALSLRNEYQRAVSTVFEAMPGQSPDRLRRAFDGQLRGRMLSVLAASQRLTPILPGTAPSVDVKLGADNLEAASSRLMRLVVLLDSMKLREMGGRLTASATRQAEQVLVTAQGILESDNTMMPVPDRVAAWQGVAPLSWPALGATDSLRFETARLPFEGLVRTLTTGVAPALAFLSRVPPAEIHLPKLVAEWSALAGNMQKYERGEPSTPGLLRRYLSTEMAVRNMAACSAAAALPDTVKAPADPFTARRRMFRAALVARCGTGGADAVKAYDRLRTTFNTRIAGRHPFVDSTVTLAADVDPAAMREFLTQYDAFVATGEVSLRSDPKLVASVGPALGFVAAIRPVRAFLAPLADDAGRPLSYLVQVTPADSVTTRELTVGAKTVPIDDAEHDLVWRFGDVVRVAERDSDRVRPVMTNRAGWSVFALSRVGGLRFFHPTLRSELMPPAALPLFAPEIGAASAATARPPVVAPPAGTTPAPAVVTPAPQQRAPVTKAAPSGTKTTQTKARSTPRGKAPATKSSTKSSTKGATKGSTKRPTKAPARAPQTKSPL
jgi:type VI secretion system protein ImpL